MIPSFRNHQSIRLRGVALASDYDAIDFDSTANVNVFEPAEGYYDQVDEKNPLLYDTVDEEASKDEEQQGAALGLLHLSDSDNPSKGRGGALSAEEVSLAIASAFASKFCYFYIWSQQWTHSLFPLHCASLASLTHLFSVTIRPYLMLPSHSAPRYRHRHLL